MLCSFEGQEWDMESYALELNPSSEVTNLWPRKFA
jgi:hypothetical protein